MLSLCFEPSKRIEDWEHIPSVTGSPFSKFWDVDEFPGKWNERYDYRKIKKEKNKTPPQKEFQNS